MKDNNDWIDVMRSSLRDAEPTPPAGGWMRLQGALAEAKPRGAVRRLYWPRIAAVAATVLLCFVAGELLLREGKSVEGIKESVIAADNSGQSADQILPVVDRQQPSLEAQVAEAYRQQIQSRSTTTAQVVTSPVEAVVQLTPATAESMTELPVVAVEPTQAVSEPKRAATTVDHTVSGAKSETRDAQPIVNYEDPFAEEPVRKHPRRRTSLSLFAGGNVTGGGATTALNPLLVDMNSGLSGGTIVSHKYAYSDYSYKHHQPLSFGVSVRKELPYGLSLESGLNYTLLWSDAKALYGTEDVTQKLHFIGIPLRLNWSFLNRGRFSMYIGAGGQLEKCVVAKFGSKRVKESGVQWSVTGAAGAQYRLGNVVSLYFEPEAGYYFTKTTLQTSRTDSPLSLTLRLGMRLTF